MTEGDVVLTPVPQADGQIKNRPAIFLREMRPHGDLLVCGVSTQIHQRVPNFDEIISPADADFGASGLVSPSLIDLGFWLWCHATGSSAQSAPSHRSDIGGC